MKFLTGLTLVKKITLLTVLGLLLGVGLFGFLAIRAVRQATDNMLQDRLTTARLMAGYVDEALDRALVELNDTAQAIGVNEDKADIEAEVKALEFIYMRFSLSPRNFYIINEDSSIIWSSSSPNITLNMLSYPSLIPPLQNNTTSISSLVPAPVSRDPVILLAAPLPGNEGNRALVVAIDLAASSIGGFLGPIRLGETGYVELVDQSGVVISRTEPGPKLEPFERSDHSGRFADLIAAGKPTRGLCHTCHVAVQKVEREDVLAFIPLSQAQWGIIIRQSEEEALAPIVSLRYNLLFSGVGFIAIVCLFAMVTVRDIVSRMKMLTAASRRIALGDLTSPVVAITRKDEIGTLAQALDDMRARLKSSYGDLEQRTKELSSLLSVSEILTSLSDLSNLDIALGNALDKTLEIMGAQVGIVLLVDEAGQILPYRVFRGVLSTENSESFSQLNKMVVSQLLMNGHSDSSGNIVREIDVSPVEVGSQIRGFATVQLRSQEKLIGLINLAFTEERRFSPGDVDLLEGIAGQVTTALENARLHREVQRKDEIRGELLHEILSIQEEERKRIARELHDDTSQVLASLTANLEAAAGLLPEDEKKIKSLLRKAEGLSVNILDGIHKLIYELRPSLLDDLGLVSATRWLADNNLRILGIKTSVKITGRKKRLSPREETALFRVIQEAVNNIARHAAAKNVSITLNFRARAIKIMLVDDGRGFDVEEAINSKERPRGLGLLGMKERVELLSGTLNLVSRPGIGTQITIEIPLNEEVSGGQD